MASDATTELRNIDVVFDNTPDPYGQLLHRRKTLQGTVSRGGPPSLPSDVLSAIFIFFMPVTLPAKADDPLLVLPQVCRAWKDLVSQSPELWASISVSFDHQSLDVQRITSIADHWLARSGDVYPLRISADCIGEYAKTAHASPDLLSSFINLILSNAHRLKQVDLRLPHAALLPLLYLPSGSFPCLETLTLRPTLTFSDVGPSQTEHTWHWPVDSKTLQSAPMIREITYSPVPLFTSEEVVPYALDSAFPHFSFAPGFSLPWARLKLISFPLTAFTPATWCSILTECPTLEGLHIAIKPSSEHHDSTGLIHLKHLKQLYISAFCGGAQGFLRHLMVPQLKVFAVLASQIPPSLFLAFQGRSNFVLEEFALTSVNLPANDVESFFQNFSGLKGLRFMQITTQHFPVSFWDRIRRAELLPKLERLVIQPTAAQIPFLVDILEAKWGNDKTLFEFYNVGAEHLPAVKEELSRLDKYPSAEVERRVKLTVV
ncbi:hypothetical protein B0H13DRAFT_2075730 [Mycena leptocephala]|nr:hypothetical protein B0H13DRAFT_2075730 [Mycena leptocephala]